LRRQPQEEKALGYHEPPSYIRRVDETEAAALMAAGDWTGAKKAYKNALVQRPRSGFPLYGIATSSEQAANARAAAAEYAEFVTAMPIRLSCDWHTRTFILRSTREWRLVNNRLLELR
jgi:hypothetical protein